MKTSDFDYNLPEGLIAKFPPKIRGSSRLLVLDKESGGIYDKKYIDLPEFLNKGDLVVLNDTKVIKARLIAKKQNGAKREIIILEKHGYDENWHSHKILYKRKLNIGDELIVGRSTIYVKELFGDGTALVKSKDNLLELANKFGRVPLPPYMHRESNIDDIKRYQTVWAKDCGSVAAPTASLNMTSKTLDAIKEKGASVACVTLHVGLGTFMPIRSDNLEEHKMHNEYFEIPKETLEVIKKVKNSGARIVAVGTTVARTLEYASDKINGHYDNDVCGEADIFIYPGYKFKIVDALLTNFHAPRSTVLMLTSAFAGKQNLENAYKHAIENGYSFLSYGDSMLIL